MQYLKKRISKTSRTTIENRFFRGRKSYEYWYRGCVQENGSAELPLLLSVVQHLRIRYLKKIIQKIRNVVLSPEADGYCKYVYSLEYLVLLIGINSTYWYRPIRVRGRICIYMRKCAFLYLFCFGRLHLSYLSTEYYTEY